MAGEVTERLFGSEMMFQVDVPAYLTNGEVDIEAFTQFINPKAIYRLSPVSELLARAAVQNIALKPVHVFNAASDIKLILEGSPRLNPFYEEE